MVLAKNNHLLLLKLEQYNVMGVWDKYNNTKNKKKSVWDKYDKLTQKQNNVPTSFKERLTGTPTKQKDGTYKANTGILPFMGELGKNLYSVATGNPEKVGATLGQSIAVNRGDFNALNKANLSKQDTEFKILKLIQEKKKRGEDVSRLTKAYNDSVSTKTDSIQSLAPKSQISNKQAIGELLNMGSSMVGVGALTAGKTGLIGGKTAVNSFRLLSKTAQREALKNLTGKQILANLAKETGINTGIGYGVDVSNNLSQDKKGAAMFKPGLGTTFGALGTGLLGGQEAARLQKANSAARISDKFNQTFNIPEVGIKPGQLESPDMKASRLQQEIANRSNPSVNKLPSGETIEMQSPEINASIRKINEVPPTITPEVPKTAIEKRAESFNSRNDFIKSERSKISFSQDINKNKLTKGFVSEVPKLTDKQLGDVWDTVHTTPTEKGLPPLQPKPISQPKQKSTNTEIPKSEVPKTKEETFKEQADTIDEKAQADTNNDPLKVDSINIKAEGEKATKYIETFGVDKARRVALKLDGEPEGVRASAVLAELKNKAQKEGDYALAKELAVSDSRKMSSQDINLAKLEDPNSFDLAIKEIYESKRKGKNIVTKFNEKSEINSIAQKIRKAVDSVNLDNLSIKKLAASLICK